MMLKTNPDSQIIPNGSNLDADGNILPDFPILGREIVTNDRMDDCARNHVNIYISLAWMLAYYWIVFKILIGISDNGSRLQIIHHKQPLKGQFPVGIFPRPVSGMDRGNQYKYDSNYSDDPFHFILLAFIIVCFNEISQILFYNALINLPIERNNNEDHKHIF